MSDVALVTAIAGLAFLVLRATLRAAERRGWIRLDGKGGRAFTSGLGAVDEVFSPYKHEVQVQQRHEDILPVPSDSGDPPPPPPGDQGHRYGRSGFPGS